MTSSRFCGGGVPGSSARQRCRSRVVTAAHPCSGDGLQVGKVVAVSPNQR